MFPTFRKNQLANNDKGGDVQMPNNIPSYTDEIVAALEELGGTASLTEINDRIEQNGRLTYIQTNPNWKDNVRATIQRHCSATRSYRGADDMFYSVYGLGEGYWGLNSYRNRLQEGNIIPIEQRQIDAVSSDETLTETKRETIILARVGQGRFRQKIVAKYQKCIITGISDQRLLLASHIKPWRSADNSERISSENGLLLSPLYDKLFDKGLITFRENGTIIVSGSLSSVDVHLINIDRQTVYLRDMSYELKKNMQYHNDKIFVR